MAITDNVVTGQGPVDYIAQNGIQVGYGAMASVMRNKVTDNSYTGLNGASSGGILVIGGAAYGTCPTGPTTSADCPYTVNTRVIQNTASGNDVGVWLSNADANSGPPASATNIKVVNNVLSDAAVTNKTGCTTTWYQAGVSDEGNNDKIVTNSISGLGYANNPTGLGCGTFSIDTTVTARAKVHANTVTP